MIIPTQQVLVNLAGEDLKVGEEKLTLGKAIANILLADQTQGKMKLWILAQKFYKEEEIDLDAADLILVKIAVQKSQAYGAIVAGQIEEILEQLK